MDVNTIKQLIDAQRSQFETWVLACVARDLAFFRQYSTVICVAHEGARFSAYDFEQPLDNVIYEALKKTRELLTASEVDVVPQSLVFATIQQMYANPSLPDPRKGAGLQILQSELPQLLIRTNQILTFDTTSLPAVVGPGVAHWIQKSRMQKLSLSSTSAHFDPASHAELIASIQRHVLTSVEPPHVFRFGEGINIKRRFVERISSGIPKLDDALGGGFGRGESTLGVAPQGAGKTVFASQLAGFFGLQKKMGLLISTEQKHEELELRMISNFGEIPFGMVKDGINKERLPPDVVKKIEDTEAKLRDYVFITKWSSDKGQSVKTSLDAEIAEFVRVHGAIDWLVFDWIGGALGEMSTRDLQVLRLIYKQAADHVCVMAEKYDIPAIAFAQANMAQAMNKPRVDATMITENKQLGEKYTNGFGISALMQPFDPNESRDRAPVFLDVQKLFMWKARKSEGGLISVKRDFGHQRFR